MKRREFNIQLGIGAAFALVGPLSLRAQHSTAPIIGWLNPLSRETIPHLIEGFNRGLGDAGFVDGHGVVNEYRWARGDYARLQAFAAELIARRAAVIFAVSPPAVAAAKAATTSVPIVFLSGLDPVKSGFVSSLSIPGANVTGVSLITSSLGPKRFEILREMVPAARKFAVLVNPSNSNTQPQLTDLHDFARVAQVQLSVLYGSDEREIAAAFASIAGQGPDALLIGADPVLTSRRQQIVTLAARHALPAIYDWSEYALAGGLISYGTSLTAAYRQAGAYVGRILKGARPGELPIVQSSTFELVINLKTARELGLTVPRILLARANQVVE